MTTMMASWISSPLSLESPPGRAPTYYPPHTESMSLICRAQLGTPFAAHKCSSVLSAHRSCSLLAMVELAAAGPSHVLTATSFSSGGFSNYFVIPSYQTADVAAHLSTLGATNSRKFNRTGRGFPDVAAQGVNFEIAWAARRSSPLVSNFAGFLKSHFTHPPPVTLLNDRFVGAGKPPLGFLSPFLYSATGRAALNDITSGDNSGCNTNGFPAVAGWDPVTGLGT
ncbi:peptidase S8/S53 domain-containing protein [Mycena sanguinolenta]|nr:peptidase S8/S53 domain-containing protein [Mycena sanguinolenta]